MLQKIIVAILSVVSMVATSIVPAGWFADEPAPGVEVEVVRERISTLGYAPGESFARIAVLWAEVDGERLREDAWGEGTVDSIRFKVGVKHADGNSLRLGERTVILSPTDVFTIRGFQGRFSFSGIGTSEATVALDGTVQNTLVRSADGGTLATHGRKLESAGAPRGTERLAYVELPTGQSVGTLEVAPGSSRKLTTSAGDQPPGSGATALDVKWVKFDGALVDRYAYGDGEVALLEFQPDARFPVRLNFSGEEHRFQDGDRVQVREFLGSWSVVQRPGGGARLKLDGWAGSADVIPGTSMVNSAPDLAFTYAPLSPSTRDIVVFKADGDDPDGSIIVYEWTFLRKVPEVGEHTTDDVLTATHNGPVAEHRFTRPGTWEVTLRAVDDEGGVATITQDILVANTAPASAFDWYPNAPLTLEQVRFYDRSSDLDGGVLARRWDFGDGASSTEREPTKAYAVPGNYEVRLTVTDANGATSTSTQLLSVRNSPPDCSFSLDPPSPASFERVRFVDSSTDREGVNAAWNWTVEDLENATAPVARYLVRNPEHTFLAADTHRVTLRVTDTSGHSTTCSTDVDVQNSPPIAGFTWSPLAPKTREFTYLNSTSNDPDGRVVSWEWTIEGDPTPKEGARIGYSFPRSDSFDVTLTVTDNGGLVNSVTQQVIIANSAPVPAFVWTPTSPTTGQSVRFTNTSRDPDGDTQAKWDWTFGDGGTGTGPQVFHTYADNGTYPVTLRVEDSKGNARSITQLVLVRNRLPTATITYTPNPPFVGDNVTFKAKGTDPDGTVAGYQWLFEDGTTVSGDTARFRFLEHGPQQVKLYVTDNDGGRAEVPLTITVRRAGPVAEFSWAPTVGGIDRPVAFTDLSVARGSPILNWGWSFGDGRVSQLANPTHSYNAAGSYVVRLTVTDEDGNSDSAEHTVNVTATPVPRFTVSTLTPTKGQTVTFTDTSFDPDGTIAARVWKIAGTVVSESATFTHAFTTRGTHTVQLTVTDDDNISASRFENVSVQNVKPTAAFTYTPAAVVVGEPAVFTSTSSDPDGSLVAAKTSWTVEGTTIRPSPDPAQLTYLFTTGGIKSVGLSVEDDAGATASTSKSVIVYSSAAAAWSVAVRYADGTIGPVDGTINFFNARDKTIKSVANGGVAQDATNGRLTLQLGRGEWVVGDAYTVSGTIRGRTFSFSYTTVAADAGANRQVGLVILPKSLALPDVVVHPGDEAGELAFLPNLIDLGATPGTYYASTTEPVTGTVTGRWASPAGVAAGATVQVWMNRSIANPHRLPVLNGPDVPVLGFIQKVEGSANANGVYTFEMPLLLLDYNPPGWYTLDVLLSWPASIGTHIAPTRTTAHVYIDVEGLFEAVLGKALP